MTSFYNKYESPKDEHPDFWILVQIKAGPNDELTERFFVLSHAELAKVQAKRNRAYWERRGDVTKGQRLTWRRHYELSQNGVDNVKLPDVGEYEDKWDRIVEACNYAGDD